MLETYLRELAVATYAAAFVLLAVRGVRDWRRRGDRSSLWFAAAFGALSVAVIVGAAFDLAGEEPGALVTRGLVVLLAAYPPCMLAFAAAFGTITRTERIASIAVFAVLAAWAALALEPTPPGTTPDAAMVAYSIAFVGAWLAVSLRIITSLWFASRRRPGIVRGRMRFIALGILLLDLALLLQAVDTEQRHQLVTAIVAALAAVALLLGSTPPHWVRVLLRERDLRALRSAVAGIASATSERDVLEALLPGTRAALGVDQVALVPFGRGEVIAAGLDADEVDAIRRSVAGLELSAGTSTTVVDGRRVTRGAASWIVVHREARGAFFDGDDLEVLSSMDAIVRMSIDRIRDAASIREHEQQLQTAVDIAEIGKWYWDIGAEGVWWSPRMYDIFAVDRHEPLTYERYRALLAPEERERMADVVAEAVRTREGYEVQHRIVRQDGSEAWVESRARVLLDAHGEPTRITGVTIDITERHRYEQELLDAVEVEREAARRLRELDELKGSILSAVSHELRTPLTAVHGLAVVLQDRMEELDVERRRELIRHLVAETERLGSLLSDLLDIDRLRRGAVAARRSPVAVRQLVLDVLALGHRSDRVVVDVPELEFPLDAPKVERIVENLVVNAEKYAGDGATIRIDASLERGGLELRVDDDGPGVPEHLRERVFEPFNRGDAELGHAPGTGVGLSLVRQFARLHGGRAWVEDSPTGGARFVVWFAFEPESERVIEAAPA
jgi:PAS domain S-box-containing protein